MPTKYIWTTADKVSSEILTKLIESSGKSLRAIEEETQNEITYSRIYDIEKKRRNPVRLSEFITLCQVCDADPVQILAKVIEEAERREQQSAEEQTQQTEPDNKEYDSDYIVAHWKELGLAALYDPNKEIESQTPLD